MSPITRIARFYRPLLIFSCLALVGPPLCAHGDEAHDLRFDNGLWLGAHGFEPATVFVIDGRLRRDWSGAVDGTIDLDGGYVVPPLANAHRHAFADGADIEAQRVASLAAGIFYVKNPNNRASSTAVVREQVNRPTSVDVIWSNGGLTASGGHPIQIYEGAGHGHGVPVGPLGDRWAGDAYVVIDTEADLEARWSAIRAGRPDFIKIYLLASEAYAARRDDPRYVGRRGLDPALLPAIVARAHADGLTVSAHVETAADVRHALGAGVDEINHLPLERLGAEDARRLATAGVTVVTTLLSHRPSAHVPDLEAVHRHNLRLLRSAGVRLALGTDNNDVSVLDELERVASLAALTPREALQLATEATARAIFPSRAIGGLDDGFEASFLVLDGDPLADLAQLRSVRMRVKQGRVLALPANRPSIAEALVAPLMAGDVAAAVARYRALRAEEPAAYDFGEPELNALGYRLLQHGQAAAAATLLALNAEVFPHSANAQDSLAEARIAAGDTAGAIAACEQVLALLPTADYDEAFRQQLEATARQRLHQLSAGDTPGDD